MAQRMEIYRCELCGNIVEVVHGGKGQLVCCGHPMNLMPEQTTDAALEKHVPIIETDDSGTVKVTVGSTLHPMIEKHYIEWIELIDKKSNRTQRIYLLPGEEPVVHFHVCPNCVKHVFAREYCSIHGLWKS